MDGEKRPERNDEKAEQEELLEDMVKLELSEDTNSKGDWKDKDKDKDDGVGEAAEGEDKFHDCEDVVQNAENDNETEEFSEASEILLDDFVDEVHLKEVQDLLTKEQLKVCNL